MAGGPPWLRRAAVLCRVDGRVVPREGGVPGEGTPRHPYLLDLTASSVRMLVSASAPPRPQPDPNIPDPPASAKVPNN